MKIIQILVLVSIEYQLFLLIKFTKKIIIFVLFLSVSNWVINYFFGHWPMEDHQLLQVHNQVKLNPNF